MTFIHQNNEFRSLTWINVFYGHWKFVIKVDFILKIWWNYLLIFLLLLYFTFLGKPFEKRYVTFVLISILFFVTIFWNKGVLRNVLALPRKKQQCPKIYFCGCWKLLLFWIHCLQFSLNQDSSDTCEINPVWNVIFSNLLRF